MALAHCSASAPLAHLLLSFQAPDTNTGQSSQGFLLATVARGSLVPQPGIETAPRALEAQNLNHWTAREVPAILDINDSHFISPSDFFYVKSPIGTKG